MPAVTQEQVIEQLRTVNDPDLNRDLVSLGMVEEVRIDGRKVHVNIALTTPACPMKDRIRKDIEAAVGRIEGVKRIEVEFGAQVRSARDAGGALPEVKNVVAVGAGKGGVGKSTASVLLSVGLQRAGAKVGLLDADVYGPSVPTLMGASGRKPVVEEDKLVPVEVAGIKMISIGFLVPPSDAMIMRGPMVHGVVKQFLEQVDWGALDYLIVDLPPGTGDVPLTLAQSIPMTGAVVICTPQDVALQDARRAVQMYGKLQVDCLGIIENMSYYLCPKCGHRDELFDHGGAAEAAAAMKVPFLGEIPLNAKVREFGDAGRPDRVFTDTADFVQKAVDDVVGNVAAQVSMRAEAASSGPSLRVLQ
jgi:ATP-binding protein involved in chromosome partitioning